MMDDLKKLAEDAAKNAYDPRAKKCWPWSHEWTMWKLGRNPNLIWNHMAAESRRCLRCGKNQVRNID